MGIGKLAAHCRIYHLLTNNELMSPLKLKILNLTSDISKIGLLLSGLTLIVFLIRFTIDRATTDFWDHGTHWSEMVRFLIICVFF